MTDKAGTTKGKARRKPADYADLRLRDSVIDFRVLAEASLNGIIVYQDEHVVYVNPAAMEMIGYSRDELLRMKFWEVMHPEFQEIVRERGVSVLRGEQGGSRTELKVVRKDGGERWMDTFSSRVEYNGKPAGLVTVVDITERKQMETTLKLTQISVDRAYDEIFWIEQNGKVFYVNNATCRQLNYTREELQNMYVWEFDPTFSPEKWMAYWLDLKKNGFLNFETTHKSMDGKVYPVEIMANYVEYEGKEYSFAFVRDITERKRAEEALRESEAMLAKSQEMAHIGSWVWDVKTGEISRTAESYRIFGLLPDEYTITYEKFLGFIVPEDRERVANEIKSSLEYGTPYDITYRIRRKDGPIRILQSWGEPVKDEDDRVVTVYGTNQDITERKLAEERIAYLASFPELNPNPIFEVSIDGLVRYANHAAKQLFPDLAVLQTDHPILSGFNMIVSDLRGGKSYLVRDINFKDTYLQQTINLVPGSETVRFYMLDITERKQAEMALRESENKFRALAETSPAAIFFYQGEKYLYVNPMAETLTGYSRDELLTEDAWGWIHADFRDLVRDRAIRRQRGELLPSRYEVKYCSRDGREGWVDFTAGLVEYGGKPAGLAMAFDISERKRAEDAIRESNEMLHLVMKNIPQRIFWKDTRSVYMGCNDNFALAAGVGSPENIVGKTDFDLAWTREESEAFRRDDREVMDNDRPKFHIIEPQRQADGTQSWLDTNKVPLHDANGIVFGILGTYEDITDRKLAEIHLKEAKAQAELYLDLLGHDITNMNQALMGYLEIMDVMRESGENDKGLIDSSIEVINRSSRMINDVKKLTQIQTERISLKNVDVCEILSAVKSKYSNIPGRSVTINYSPGRDCMVKSGDLLKDVFENLVDNAIRHSKGPVTIDLAIDRVKIEGQSFLRITVADTGPGILDDLKKKIFMSPKENVDKTSRRGFGLYLVRTLIDHYDGRISVEDRIAGDHTKGAKFVVKLPAADTA